MTNGEPSSPKAIVCFSCKKDLGLPAGNIGRSETCAQCGADVRVCYNCKNYDPASYNECREPMAERVLDKNRRNFCDYFSLAGGESIARGESRESALKALDDIFKK